MNFEKMLTELCELDGISGDESSVREYILREIEGFCEYKIDNLGNIIAFKKGKNSCSKKVLLSAHMDEVGMIVTSVKSDGTLTISPVGGVDAEAVIGRRVTALNGELVGVVGAKAVHNLSSDEKGKVPSFSSLYADFGFCSKEEALTKISLGDSICFQSKLQKMGDNLVCGKAIDDRFGCAVLISLIKSELLYDCYFTFVVQEEVGLRGARVAAYTVSPDMAIVIESTTAADIPLSSGEKQCCKVGDGTVVSYMDRSTIYDRELYALSGKIADENELKWQTKTMVAGGNDSGAIHLTKGGVRTIAFSVPCRYLHTASCTASLEDMKNLQKLTEKMLEKMCEM